MASQHHRSDVREGHGAYGKSHGDHNQQFYQTHWEVTEEEEDEVVGRDNIAEVDENRLRSAVEPSHMTDHNSHQYGGYRRNGQKQRGMRHEVAHGADVGSRSDSNNMVSPRQKFNVEFDYEDNIETTSSGSFSSGYGRPSQHHHQSHQEAQVRYFADGGGRQNNNRPIMNKGAYATRGTDIPENLRDEKDGSEIYVVDTAYMKPPASVYSHYSGKSRAPSEMSSVKTKTSRKGGVVVETMAAPNPCCPNTKGVCWLLVLVNLGLILVTLGFSIVLQLFDPPFVWYFGIAFLIVGFIALIASLIFCMHFCRESEEARRRGLQPGEMYWTHHWQKRIALPGMTRHETEKVADDASTVYSARNDHHPDDKYYRRDERRDMTPIHTYNHHQQQRN